ncbi:MAG TPA: bifunctional acetate--CoA ligase family protein/GNAT family N-acetyltransferase [Candidatus Sulfotelmatobacter sp.]|nr:bifunctional acetate--CoA ligase family protein/GNAT family N-acetyltransferase [Candidatus Sulfotelmatobacter sp.]
MSKPHSTPPGIEAAHDILRQSSRRPLDPILAPKSVAVIGATERKRSVGRTVLHNLVSGGFEGKIYPVNPIQESILGLHAFPNVAALPEVPDLAVIITPPKTVPGIIKECAVAGIKGVIIISAGFKEIGPEGAALEQQVIEEARRSNIRIIGPNCLGVMVPGHKFNATFAADMAHDGSVGFISQSGALCTAILDWSLKENVGFSAFVSLGSMLDVSWGDLINHLGDDPNTKSIVIYMESIGDARSFLSAAREVALTKPIIVIKPGRTEAAAKAAASHTGSLTGSDEVLQAAFQRAGVLRVETMSELFDMAEVLAKQPRPKGPRLTIVTNAGGPGVLATDALITSGAQLAELTPETMASLNQILPPTWSHNNPVDIIGDAGPELYARAVDIVAKDPNTDGLLVILTPQSMTDPTATAEEIAPFAHIEGKPIIASWMGAGQVEKGEDILNTARIPTFKYPDRAAKAFNYMWRYTENLRSLYETPASPTNNGHGYIDREAAAKILSDVRKTGRTILTEFESKKLLTTYGIPTVETLVALTENDAVREAARLGFPVVLKLYSETITHKTDVGGVQLNLRTASAVRQAWKAIETSVTKKVGKQHFQGVTVQPMIKLEGYELIVGSSVDPQFGPVLLFGTGGQLVEVFKDRALGLPPLNATLARRMMERTKIFTALKGVRGRKAVDIAGLEQLLVRFSQLVVEQPWIAEIDINPLLVSTERLYALDARVVLHDPKTPEENLPRPAIRPYPVQFITPWRMKNRAPVTIRPIRPEDEPMMGKFHETLSEESVYHRYFSALKLEQRVTHERLTRICFNDYDREIALVAESTPANESEEKKILGVGRLSRQYGTNDAEFAVLVNDNWQNLGLGHELLKQLIEVGRTEKLDRIVGEILAENNAMRHICKKLGFKLVVDEDKRTYNAAYKI